MSNVAPGNSTGSGKSADPGNREARHKETDEDFVVRLHNEGKRKEEIAADYARQRQGRESPTDADKRFVDQALTNLEG